MLTSLNTFSQLNTNIKGTVKDSSQNSISDAIVILTYKQKQFYQTTDLGGDFFFSVPFEKNLEVSLEFKHISFQEKTVFFLLNDSTINVPVIFLNFKNSFLSEVIVVNKPMIKSGDTTIFNLSSFKNKLDANLEDVLKKMPGMDVDESGNIKYNNKPIENIMIEGDVLSKNYKLISKNITPDMIDKVEIIDKYNSNPILKDLTNSQKQMMNLILKNPKKLRTFGNFKAGIGVENKKNIGGNIFVINSKIKSMIIGNNNNTGQSPYSEFSVDEQYSKEREYEFDQTLLPDYIIENKLFYQSLFRTNTNSLFNDSKLGVVNNSYRLNKKIVVKLFTDLYSDKVNQYQQTIVQNNLNSLLSYKENIQKAFKPLNFNNNFEIKYNTEKSQLLFAVGYNNKKYKELNSISSLKSFNTNLESDYKRIATGAFYTYRIDSLKAFEISLEYNKDSKSQFFKIEQTSNRLLDSIFFTNFQNQNTNTTISYLTGEVKLFYKKRKVNTLSLKFNYFNSRLNSSLLIRDSINNNLIVPNFINEINLINNDILLNYKTNYSAGKILFNTDIGILFNSNSGSQSNFVNKKNKLFPIPKIKVSYNLNSKQQLSLNIGMDASYPILSNTFLNPLLLSYRSIKSNESIPSTNQSLKYGLDYSYINIDNATSFIFSYNHSSLYLSEINNLKYTADFDYISTRYERIPQKFSNVYTKFDKYFYSINTGFSFKNSFISFLNPLETNGLITSKKFFILNSSFTLRPKINKNVNCALGLDYSITKDTRSKLKNFQLNPFIDITSAVSKKISLGSRVNYFRSDYSVSKLNYIFANFYCFYTTKSQKMEGKISIINAFDTNLAISGNTNTAISKSINTQILPRFGLIEIKYKF